MGRTIVRKLRLLSLSSLATLLLLLTISSSGRAVEPVLPDPQTALRNGLAYEQERNWKEAIRIYRTALEQWQNDDHLKLGLRRAKFHYAIDRRYLDDSFKSTLKPMTLQASLSLYDDMITNIQSYFIEPLNVSTIVAHGTESLWLALGNEKFVKENLFGASPESIEKLRRTIHERYWNKPLKHRFDAQQLVTEVCELCHQEVGLESGPVVLEYAFGACNCLDDYSTLLTPSRGQDLSGNIKGEFVGIGIVMEGELGSGMGLQQILPNSPAAEAGLRRGDFITAVDGTDCRFLPTEEAAEMLSGIAGSRVKLTIRRESQPPFEVTCTRREVKISSIPVARIIDSEQGIAYIQMTGFQQSTVFELDAALQQLQKQGMRSLIWDLRENPGGLLDVSIEVADRFLDDGIIVSTRGRVADQTSAFRAHGPGTWKMPLVLLVDENSASASEIIAGAIRDHRRGTVVGRKTYGKWSVQTIFTSRFGTSVRLTTAKFYSPNGSTYGAVGLAPDVVVEATEHRRPLGEIDSASDPDVQAAFRVLRTTGITSR